MTDDRAKRLRDLRNRTSGGDSDAADGSNESDESTTNAAESDEPTGSAESAGEATNTNDSESEPNGANEETDTATADDSVEESTSESPTSETSQSEPQPEPGSNDDRETAGSEPVPETESASETVSFDEDEAIANSAASDSAERSGQTDESEPQQEETIESKLGGAIADTSMLAMETGGMNGEATVDSSAIGDESTEYGQSGVGRDTAVLEQDSTLLHSAHDDQNTVQMLEFYLNENRYAIEIDRISAIVEMKGITRFPRGPEAIDGVTDLRGEITGVLDPTTMLDVERNELSSDQYIVVLKRDDDKQKLGIRVTDVLQAVTYRESQIDETGTVMDTTGEHQHEFITGIIKKNRDGETSLVTWLDIDKIIENTG
ncbi:chemotaxis protein CheW (plasmid) [Natrialbaceae archaeon A-arb3/5]